MLATPMQARELWCPFAKVTSGLRRAGDPSGAYDLLADPVSYNRLQFADEDAPGTPHGSRCIAQRCMAWMWTEIIDADTKHTTGFCSLAGDERT